MPPALCHNSVYWLLQDYLGELKHCLNQHTEMESFDYQWEARLHQLISEAFMLAEEIFRQRAHGYDSKATTLCRHHHKPTPENVYAQLLVSYCVTPYKPVMCDAQYIQVHRMTSARQSLQQKYVSHSVRRTGLRHCWSVTNGSCT